MFAGSGTGGIPGRGSDRSATGLATGQVAAVLEEAERTGEPRPALEWSVRIGAGRTGVRRRPEDHHAARDHGRDGHGRAAEPYHSPRPLALQPVNLAHPDPPCTTQPGGARPALIPAESEIDAGGLTRSRPGR